MTRQWLVMHRMGTDAEWYVTDPQPHAPDDATTEQVLEIVRDENREAGVPEAVRRGSFGGEAEVMVIDLRHVAVYKASADHG